MPSKSPSKCYQKTESWVISIDATSSTTSSLEGSSVVSPRSNSRCPYRALSHMIHLSVTDSGQSSIDLPHGPHSEVDRRTIWSHKLARTTTTDSIQLQYIYMSTHTQLLDLHTLLQPLNLRKSCGFRYIPDVDSVERKRVCLEAPRL